MSHLIKMRERRCDSLIRIITRSFALAFCVSIFFASSTTAAAAIFKVQSVILETASGDIVDFSDTNIESNLSLSKINDSAKYTITIKNTDSSAHAIETITDDNSNPYVAYEYDMHTNEKIEPGSDLVFVVTAKYVSYIADDNDRVQTSDVRFRIQFADYEEVIAITPDTNDDIFANVVIFAISLIGLIIVAVLARRRKLVKYAVVVVAIALAASATSATKAIVADISDFTLSVNLTLEPGRLIHYDGNYPDGGSMADSYWTAGGTLKPNTFTAIGYHFAGWSLEPDDEKVYDDKEPMDNIPDGDEPLTLYVIWEPNVYTVVFHANSEQATGSMEPMTEVEYYGRRRPLTYNDFVLDGHRFIGWKEDNAGDLITDHSSASYFEVEHGGTVNLYAQWELVPEGIDYYKNGSDVVGITYRQENFGRTTKLRTQNYKRDGYGFAGWNTEPDGTGAMYGPNETVTMPEGGLKLYATWIRAEEGVTMQAFDDTAEPYASYPNGKVIALKDNRDNQAYAVAKLADGKWWMIENLRLVPTGIQFTAENTNNPAPVLQTATITNHLCEENTAACINQFVYRKDALDRIEYSSSSSLVLYGTGVYYNVFAATAGHAIVDEDNLVTGRVAGDICPKGWHLPSSGRGGDFSALDVALGGTGLNFAANTAQAQKYYQAPINFVASGWAEGLHYRNVESDAVYLTSDTDGMKHIVGVFVDNAIEIVGEKNVKYDAYTVRCLAD